MTGAWAGAGCGGRGLVAGLRVGLACGVLLLPGFGVSSSSPQVPGHPTSICDTGVNNALEGNKLLNLSIFNKQSSRFFPRL